MPNAFVLDEIRRQSLVGVDATLRQLSDTGQRYESLPRRFRARFTDGWRIDVGFTDQQRTLLVLVDANFPYSLPRISLESSNEVLLWPHVESDGLLCLQDSSATWDPSKPEALIIRTLGDACSLIEDNVTERLSEDFRDEFLSYWGLAVDKGQIVGVSLVAPTQPSRTVSLWRSQSQWVFADDDATLERWLSNRSLKKPANGYPIEKCPFAWIDRPLLPEEYPSSGSDVIKLMKRAGARHVGWQEHRSASPLLIGSMSKNGACFASVCVRWPLKRPVAPGGRSLDYVQKGFRPGRLPETIQLQRAFGSMSKTEKRMVVRADPSWIHGRDHNRDFEHLWNSTVAVIGLGSLGSPVVRLLAQSGIGSFILVDGKLLEWTNISRHALGATKVGQNKATAMAQALQSEFPHLREVNAYSVDIGPSDTALIRHISEGDLVVCTTGDWASELLLERLRLSTLNFPPVIYAWMESHALAGHAVLFGAGDACLRCGMSATGRPHLTVTEWDKEPLRQTPACGGSFMPYGALEVISAAAAVADICADTLTDQVRHATHKVWIGKKRSLERFGGRWSQKWINTVGDPGMGEYMLSRTWENDAACELCGLSTDVA